jgi:hypothetical protein
MGTQDMERPAAPRRANLRSHRRGNARRLARRRDSHRPANQPDARARRNLHPDLRHPWWISRRRRSKVRVERQLEAWPDIAHSVGLAGSQIMSAIVDVWGWHARLRLARGQTINDVIAKIPAIESALGTHRGAVRVHPTADDLANRCDLRVLNIDPHANAITWPGPSANTITEPIDLLAAFLASLEADEAA